MAIGNFYIDTYVDGRLHPLSGGPRNRRGGFTSHINVRHNRQSHLAFTIHGEADALGNLTLIVRAHTPDGPKEVARVNSHR